MIVKEGHGRNRSWVLVAWESPPERSKHYISTRTMLPLPRSWRLLSATWLSRGSPASVIKLAGWDGSTIVVGTVHWDPDRTSWVFRRSFRVRPLPGSCPDDQ